MARKLAPTKSPAPIEPKEAHFQIDAALFEELGERLVSRPEIALAELVKNSYDADASRCNISINRKEIKVSDSGHGLTETEFLGNWMVVSTQDKGRKRFSRRYSRSMAGSKGVGRFSARFLGNWLELVSVAKNPADGEKYRLTATFDWKKIARERTIQSIVIPYHVELVASTVRSGTTLAIRDLREHVRDLAQDRVKTDILRLIDPAGGLEAPSFHEDVRQKKSVKADPGFAVTFKETDSATDDDVEPSQLENVAKAILDAYVARARIVVDEKGTVDLRIYQRGKKQPIEKSRFSLSRFASPFTYDRLSAHKGEKDHRGVPVALSDIQHLPLAAKLNSPVFVDLRFFPKRKGTFTDLNVNGMVAQSWLKEHGSFAVVDNRFVMPAYADQDSDWLSIDASKSTNERSWQSIFSSAFYPMDPADKADPQRNAMLALPRMSQLIGRIHISTQKRLNDEDDDSWLQPNMDRESLRSNGAFNLLWHLARFAAEAIAHFDRQLRLQEKEQEEQEAKTAARTALTAAISEIKNSSQIEPAYRTKVVQQLRAAEARITEAAEYEQDARLSLELMSLMGVMAGFMTHEFEKALGTLKKVARDIKKFAKLSPELQKVAEEVLENEASLANYLEYMRLFVNKAREPRPQDFKAKSQISVATGTLTSLATAHGIGILVDADAKLAGPFVPLAAYHGIIINLVSNAMKALVPKVGSGERKIRIYATNEGSRHILVCADNGIGVPEYLRDRIWDPLFTTTADEENPLGSGLGLGLSVVQRVVSKIGGRIELMEAAPPGFVTAFRVTLPLHKH